MSGASRGNCFIPSSIRCPAVMRSYDRIDIERDLTGVAYPLLGAGKYFPAVRGSAGDL